MNLDVLGLKILRMLQAEGRLSNVELADRIGLSPSPCLRRVKRLEAEGIIKGYGARINRAKVGVGVTVFVAVGLERHREEEAERFRKVVQRLRQVISCHAISGESDFLLEIVVWDLHEYSEFVQKKFAQDSRHKRSAQQFCFRVDEDRDGASIARRERSQGTGGALIECLAVAAITRFN